MNKDLKLFMRDIKWFFEPSRHLIATRNPTEFLYKPYSSSYNNPVDIDEFINAMKAYFFGAVEYVPTSQEKDVIGPIGDVAVYSEDMFKSNDELKLLVDSFTKGVAYGIEELYDSNFTITKIMIHKIQDMFRMEIKFKGLSYHVVYWAKYKPERSNYIFKMTVCE